MSGGRAGRVGTLLAVAAVGAAGIVLYRFNPAQHSFYPGCPFHRWTGLWCPFCGSLRAGHRLLHGDVAGAIGMNLFVFVSVPWLGAAWVARDRGHASARILFWSWVAAGAIFWVLRNLPWEPFRALAPG